MRSLRASTGRPVTWSECSCVIRMALSDAGSSPTAFMRRKVSRQEMPASTRMRVRELATTALLPLLPLARTVRRTAIAESILAMAVDEGVAEELTTAADDWKAAAD